MQITTAELAKKLGAELIGDAQLMLYGLAPIEEAREGDLAFLSNKKYFKYLESTKASAVIVPPEIKESTKTLLIHPQPYYAFSQALRVFYPDKDKYPSGISDHAVIGDRCSIHSSAHIGAYAVLEDNVNVAENTKILPGAFIGSDCRIGKDCIIYPNVTVREGTRIGNRVIIHSGTTIGSDGFGYAQLDGKSHKIPQVGIVVIEDDVEIGANCSIDRATLGETRIGKGTKIDNLVQIAHNVKTGENCIIISQVGISGSTKLGNNVILAGQAGLIGHLSIGDNVIVAAQSGVTHDLEDNSKYLGSPAHEMMHQKRIEAALNNLPDYLKRIREIEKRLKDME
ncbi:MAG: UDP-3-O-(3-hydroxymyristoyl)glucosamine N-acyltransferase [candidate division Zixibacteria bacterium]|nr:UDP-3-O-(3-hydroxymyristoyl)glucosamine N-acyltransferase [candidate division Zixibacteria bacterium]NIR64219.1 UDP-3-O-(3-hydroxymyristoyl)glucosamine N-acyltransferase [candidate division Zixibacteria bacterium]NIS15785.1 UDP-3-O-(3-hydroxymyristoyl)glucosamine N-acyltransferase [candidate division Zixibacteria bacterium]NIS46119.1 UDP-3-O-(3-hydroxymyristoyl)glucosamine N-acyltransferase [candidate division Zixibacteria bacterium]NIT52266.1 UDP-3-O-(3-hydroxymyristoyl)glucosamine N-acyltr